MRQPFKQCHYQRIALVVLWSMIFFSLVWDQPIALASAVTKVGRIEAMPASGLIGTWVVEGISFNASTSTEFRQDKGAFAVSVCVEVEYVDSGSPFPMTKLASKNDNDCTTPAPSGTPSATATPNTTPSATPGSEQEAYGRVESRPSPGFIGLWSIHGVTYNVPASAEFKQENGPLVVGACTKVHYFTNTTPFTLREIATEVAAVCDGAPPTPGATGTPNATSTPIGEFEVYNHVDSLPAGLVGAWGIGGVAYTTSANTEFKQEDGAFSVGGCVKLHAANTTTPATIREIETEQEFRCSSGGANAAGELFGLLQSFPTGLLGAWNIGGLTFVTDANTEFQQVGGAFAIGMTVKVHFVRDSNGINRAGEIETAFANDDNGNDDNGNGSFDGAEGHAYGLIDSFPPGHAGQWLISGIPYTATANTNFAQTDGSFAVGGKVKIEYFLDVNSYRIAQKIETTSDNGGATAPSRFMFFGFINQMPPQGFVGAWAIDQVAFVTDAHSQFKENNGLLALGAYVGVEYFSQAGHNQLYEIETHVPPGAGTNTTIGRLDDKGGTPITAHINATWVIDGVNYTITPATDLNDIQSALTIGKMVLVNSYTAADGKQVATQMRGITLSQSLYLPVMKR